MLSGYAPILFYLVILVSVAGGMTLAAWLLGPSRPRVGKLSTYECGMPLVGSSRERFSVKFYLVALLFILFDIETVFLIPWSLMHRKLGIPGLIEVLVFLVVLGVGYLYIYRRGALEWD